MIDKLVAHRNEEVKLQKKIYAGIFRAFMFVSCISFQREEGY